MTIFFFLELKKAENIFLEKKNEEYTTGATKCSAQGRI